MVALEALLTLAVIFLAVALFVSEIVTVDLAALIIMGLLMILGLVTPQEGISGFANPATITVLAMFILSAGIERSGGVGLLSQRLGRFAGSSERGHQALVVAVVTLVSAFINNTAAVAIMVPVVMALAREKGVAPSKLLIPVSFGAILGGLTTLIGTSTNILASSVSAGLGHGAFDMFEFTLPGLFVALLGLLYLLLVGRHLLPDRGAADVGQASEDYTGEFSVPAGSKAVGKDLATLDLERRYLIRVLGMREEQENDVRAPDRPLAAGDIMLLQGRREKLVEIVNFEGLTFKGPGGGREPLHDSQARLFEALLLPQSPLVGQTLEDSRFRTRFGGTVVAIRKSMRLFLADTPLKKATLHAGDALLVAGSQETRERIRESGEFLLAGEVEARTYRPDKALIAVAIFTGAVVLAAAGVADILVTSIVGAALMALLGVLSMNQLHNAIRWDVLFLLAGVIPLGIAMQRSGLAALVADALLQYGGGLPIWGLLMVLVAFTCLLTNFMSNNATVVLLAPIAATLAMDVGASPKMFILAVTFGASCAFATPIGYQTNVMIYASGRYRFGDFVRIGLPLTLLMVVAIPTALLLFYPAP